MDKILSDLSKKCHSLLTEYPGSLGRKLIAEYLQELLTDSNAAAILVPTTAGERELLYEDKDLGFCILAHNYNEPKTTPPHDHGNSWAIYAQVRGQTEMREYDLVKKATHETPGEVKIRRSYHMNPGDACVYNEGVLHSPTRKNPTSLLRIEGTDMSKVKRFKYVLNEK